MYKKNKIIFILALLIFVFYLATPVFAEATEIDPDALRVDIPGGPAKYGEEGALPKYINGIFSWAISVAGVCALIMVIFGGYQYIVSGANPELRKVAKGTIVQALIGLFLAICTFALLKTIDPNILGLDIDIPDITGPGSETK